MIANTQPQLIGKKFIIEVPNVNKLENFDWEGVKDVFVGLQDTDSIAIGFKYNTAIKDKNKGSNNFVEISIKTLAVNVEETIAHLKKLSQVFVEQERQQKNKMD